MCAEKNQGTDDVIAQRELVAEDGNIFTLVINKPILETERYACSWHLKGPDGYQHSGTAYGWDSMAALVRTQEMIHLDMTNAVKRKFKWLDMDDISLLPTDSIKAGDFYTPEPVVIPEGLMAQIYLDGLGYSAKIEISEFKQMKDRRAYLRAKTPIKSGQNKWNEFFKFIGGGLNRFTYNTPVSDFGARELLIFSGYAEGYHVIKIDEHKRDKQPNTKLIDVSLPHYQDWEDFAQDDKTHRKLGREIFRQLCPKLLKSSKAA